MAIPVRAHEWDKGQIYANEAIRTFKRWGTNMNLQLAEQNAEVVFITGKRKKEIMSINVRHTTIAS